MNRLLNVSVKRDLFFCFVLYWPFLNLMTKYILQWRLKMKIDQCALIYVYPTAEWKMVKFAQTWKIFRENSLQCNLIMNRYIHTCTIDSSEYLQFPCCVMSTVYSRLSLSFLMGKTWIEIHFQIIIVIWWSYQIDS